MLFYKVKPENDGRKIGNGLYAVANELFTSAEMKKLGAEKYCDIVEISRNKTHWFFGARFAD